MNVIGGIMELKKCPFCGGEAKWGMMESNHYVRCYNPDCLIKPTTALFRFYETKQEAIEAWNKRGEG